MLKSRRLERSRVHEVEGHTSDTVEKTDPPTSLLLPGEVIRFALDKPTRQLIPAKNSIAVEFYGNRDTGRIRRNTVLRVRGFLTERNTLRATHLLDMETGEEVKRKRNFLTGFRLILSILSCIVFLGLVLKASEYTFQHRDKILRVLSGDEPLLSPVPTMPTMVHTGSTATAVTTGDFVSTTGPVIRPEIPAPPDRHEPEPWEYILLLVGVIGITLPLVTAAHHFNRRLSSSLTLYGEATEVERADSSTGRIPSMRRSRLRLVLRTVESPVSVELTGAGIHGTVWNGRLIHVYGVRSKRGVIRASRIVDFESGAIIERSTAAALVNALLVLLAAAPLVVVVPLVFSIDIFGWLMVTLRLAPWYLLSYDKNAGLIAAIVGWVVCVVTMPIIKSYHALLSREQRSAENDSPRWLWAK
jgi:hypothetical protein